MARRLPSAVVMAVSFIPHGQLKRYGVTQEVVRGLGPRQPDETWPLPQLSRTKLRMLLQELGFEASREIWVRELSGQHVFRLFQPSSEDERKRREAERKTYRLQWLDNV